LDLVMFLPPSAKVTVLRAIWIGVLLYAAIFLFFRGNSEAVAQTTEPLTPLFSIKLPDATTPTGYKVLDAPAEIQWSPDNRYLAIFGFSSSKLFLLDVDQKQLIDRNVHIKGAPPNITWSGDASLLALNNVNLALFQVSDGKELGRRDFFRRGQCAAQPRQAGSFTADNRFLWVSCGAQSQQGSYPAAKKLTIPDLEVADSADAEATEPASLNTTRYERIAREGDKLLLSSILQTCSQTISSANQLATCNPHAACLDLETKRPCFPTFALELSPSAKGLHDLQFVPNRPQTISFWTWAQGIPPGPFDWAFEIYDFAGKRVNQFGARTEFENMPPREFVTTRDGLVIGSAGDYGKNGRLMVWNLNTGQLLQRIRTPSAWRMEISNDGKQLAVLMGREIRIYSVAQI
jgi:WD40 repeat protein